MLTLNKVIVLRNTDLKRFFNIEEFWIQRKEFFSVVKSRTIDLFFDTNKEKECFTLFNIWCVQKDNVQAEIKNNFLLARVNNEDKEYPLGRLAPFYNATSTSLSMKDRLGITFMYMMLGADEANSDIEIRYDFLVSIKENKGGIPSGEFIIRYDDWNIPCSGFKQPLSRKVIANKSGHVINISSGNQKETLQPNECVVGLFTSDGCYKLLPRHIISPDGGLQLRLVVGNNCANLEIHEANKVTTINDVKSIIMEAGNAPVYLKSDGELVFDDKCFELQSKFTTFAKHYKTSDLIAVERNHGQITFYTKDNIPF